MGKKIVLLAGTGHLTNRLKRLLPAEKYDVVHTTLEEVNARDVSASLLEQMATYMKSFDLHDIAMIYLLDEKDEHNLQLIIALISLFPQIPITASLFNENLIPHLQASRKNLTILNPAKIAAPSFVAALYQPLDRPVTPPVPKPTFPNTTKKKDRLVQKLVFSFVTLLLAAVVFFHYREHLSWVDAAYFVVVTIATVGYGDINLLQSDPISKLFVIFLILASTAFIWMIFSLTIDQLLKKRIQRALGRRKYSLEDHIIICGLGRLGYFIVEDLLQKNERVIIIEENEHSLHIDHFRQCGAEVYIGDARMQKVLADVNVSKARALISVINSDSLNLEIGLNARSFQPGLKLILRIFDTKMAEKIKEHLNIHLTLSASDIADEYFYEMLQKQA
jgi:hypothetical protein